MVKQRRAASIGAVPPSSMWPPRQYEHNLVEVWQAIEGIVRQFGSLAGVSWEIIGLHVEEAHGSQEVHTETDFPDAMSQRGKPAELGVSVGEVEVASRQLSVVASFREAVGLCQLVVVAKTHEAFYEVFVRACGDAESW